MFGKDFQKKKVWIWIGTVLVFLGALWWQSGTILKKVEGFWQSAFTGPNSYVISGPDSVNNGFYKTVDLSCNTFTNCQACTSAGNAVLTPKTLSNNNSQIKQQSTVNSLHCAWCPSSEKCMINLPYYVKNLNDNMINTKMCDWSSIHSNSYECTIEETESSDTSVALPPPVSEDAVSQLQPLLPLFLLLIL